MWRGELATGECRSIRRTYRTSHIAASVFRSEKHYASRFHRCKSSSENDTIAHISTTIPYLCPVTTPPFISQQTSTTPQHVGQRSLRITETYVMRPHATAQITTVTSWRRQCSQKQPAAPERFVWRNASSQATQSVLSLCTYADDGRAQHVRTTLEGAPRAAASPSIRGRPDCV
jgi:hypothetical protein